MCCGEHDNGPDIAQAVREAPMPDYAAVGLGPDGAPIVGVRPEAQQLARFEVTNGNVIDFVCVTDADEHAEVGIRELGGGSRVSVPTFLHTPHLSALDIFRKLAPDMPVPEALARYARPDEPVEQTVASIPDTIEVDLDVLGIAGMGVRSGDGGGGPGAQYCGQNGTTLFEQHMYEPAQYPSNAWHWSDPEANNYHRDRWTVNHKRYYSMGITAACVGPAATTHYYRNGIGNWKWLYTWHLPEGYWQWTRWNGLSSRDRWLNHRVVGPGGNAYFRSASQIWT